jgi:hypothetical protein
MGNLDLISLEEGMLPPVSPLSPKVKSISEHFNSSTGGKKSRKKKTRRKPRTKRSRR